MSFRNLRIATFLAPIVARVAQKAAAFAGRFVRSEPKSAHEARVFAHLNGLVEASINQWLNRTFEPTNLRSV